MAVVQISRIQVRRGQKNQGSGIPQLAGGEFGWAVDSRELYIGNGSVAEGAPAVGNTKLITQHDDLFTLANTYTYLAGETVQTGVTPTSPIKRTLQAALDEVVSIRSFGEQKVMAQIKLSLYREPLINYTSIQAQKVQSKAGSNYIFQQEFIPRQAQFIYHHLLH